ncbi:hypothetical protein [Falsiroseomonas sp. E2-1-a20]|uniref:hypothetical protein n=1 Tax=Falsiroseomonas sp. E2-1-a20 TaxID=3239300 RepID=UPI003F3CF69F
MIPMPPARARRRRVLTYPATIAVPVRTAGSAWTAGEPFPTEAVLAILSPLGIVGCAIALLHLLG